MNIFKKSLFVFLFLGFPLAAQIDSHGNPMFNSIFIVEDTLANCTLLSSYYTIGDNINNPESSVFVSENPSNEEIIKFARSLPAYFFMTLKSDTVLYGITCSCEIVDKKSRYSFLILEFSTNKSWQIFSETKGDIPELRAAELLQIRKEDSKELKIGNKNLFIFDETAYSIQSFTLLKDEVIRMIENDKLF